MTPTEAMTGKGYAGDEILHSGVRVFKKKDPYLFIKQPVQWKVMESMRVFFFRGSFRFIRQKRAVIFEKNYR